MVDDELDRLKGVDLAGITAEAGDAVAHGCKVNDRGHTREILEQHTGRCEGNLLLRGALHVPASQRFDVSGLDEPAVFGPQQVLEQDLERIWQPSDLWESCSLEGGQTEVLHVLTIYFQDRTRPETVQRRHR